MVVVWVSVSLPEPVLLEQLTYVKPPHVVPLHRCMIASCELLLGLNVIFVVVPVAVNQPKASSKLPLEHDPPGLMSAPKEPGLSNVW